MAVKVIPVRMDDEFDFERELVQRYEALPRSRRAQWIREVLRRGFEVIDSVQTRSTDVTPEQAPVATVRSAVEQRPVVRAHDVIPAVLHDTEAANESASQALCGFFG